MQALKQWLLAPTPTSSASSRYVMAFCHCALSFSKADRSAEYEYLSGEKPCSRMREKIRSASCELPPFAHAVIAEFQLKMSSGILLSIKSLSILEAASQSPRFEHAEMSVLKVIPFGRMPFSRKLEEISRAILKSPTFAQAFTSVFSVMTVGSIPFEVIS
eukprot:CAMPEP_0184714492 /NCGR_PEP_ID=MMETSP0314-20130426/4620_1 /TAXON_ID=38298 /ORGANISM="Rhodella maculata, Strain CCMP 736" /LENGTH=159 /DNA_ID=CAMNT_0027177417 /DNA_START=287 /DNA_END=762 /DNA_ORIENTATION=+